MLLKKVFKKQVVFKLTYSSLFKRAEWLWLFLNYINPLKKKSFVYRFMTLPPCNEKDDI